MGHATMAKSATRPIWTVRWLDKIARSIIWEQVCSYSVVAFYSSSVAVFSTAPPHRLAFLSQRDQPKEPQNIARDRLEFAAHEYISALQPPGSGYSSLRLSLTAATLSAIHSTLLAWYGQHHNSQRHLQTSTRSTSKHVAGRTSIG